MKSRLTNILLLGLALSGCSSLEGLKDVDISSIQQAGDLAADLNNGKVSDLANTGSVDAAGAISAGADLGKAIALSDEEVREMALQFAEYSDSQSQVAGAGNKYAKRLQSLISRHQKEDGLELKFKVYMTPDINAFALADGNIRVFSGLMDMLSDEELLAVIGHEIGHVKLGHIEKHMRLAYAASGVRKGLSSVNNKVGVLANSELVGGMVEEFLNAQFSQSQEEEADSYSAQFLARNGYGVNASITVLEKLAKLEEEAGEDSKEFRFLAAHPAPGRRAERLAKQIEDLGDGIKTASIKRAEDEEPGAASEEAKLEKQRASEAPKQTAGRAILAKATAEKSSVQALDRVSPGYYIQLSAEPAKAEAEAKASVLRASGFSALTQEVLVHGTPYYRVLVGPYKSKDLAKSNTAQVRASSLTDQEPFIQKLTWN